MSQILAVTVIPLGDKWLPKQFRSRDLHHSDQYPLTSKSMTDSALKDSNSSSSGLSLDECEEAGEEVSDTVRVTSQALVAQHWLLNGRFYVVLAGVKCRTPHRHRKKHTVTSLLPDCALAVHSSMTACDSMQAAITLTCMARNSLTL